MASAKVQSKTGTGSGTAPSVTLTNPATAGNLLVAWIAGSATQASITISGWTDGTLASGGTGGSTRGGKLLWKIAAGGEQTITGALTSAFWTIQVIEISGIDTGTPLAGTVGTSGENSQLNASGTVNTPSITPTSSLAACVVCGVNIRSISGAPYSAEAVSGSNVSGVVEDEDSAGTSAVSAALWHGFISSTTGAYQGSATGSTSAVGIGAIAIFRDAVAAAVIPDLIAARR